MERVHLLSQRLVEMEIVLSSYIELNKDEKKLGKYIEKKAKRDSEARAGKDMDNK